MKSSLKVIFITMMVGILTVASAVAGTTKQGDEFPSGVKLIDVDGAEFSLDSMVGKSKVVVIFFNTSCGMCLKELRQVQKASTSSSTKVLGVAVDMNAERVKKVIAINK